ncbi:MAG: serine/threonine protein kinase [Chloroflexi bacterium]|nr:serine/threonine protein kinase [Chloroflexota bacterium]
MPIKPGDKLDQYEIIAELGRGGMATVFKARQRSMNREVAIKVLPEQFLHDPNFLARFTNEARVIAGLEHRSILPVYDYGEIGGAPYIVMRLMPSGSLRTRLKSGPIPAAEVVRLIGQIAEALDFAHARGVIHRDLKPDNVLLDDQGNAYLSDFGIAKVIESTAQTTGSMIVGTPSYMSPEQAKGQKATRLSDLYALGAMTFELLTARPPFQADDIIALLFKHANDPVPPIRDFNSNAPEALQAAIEKAMAKQPDDRYPTAREYAADLERRLRGESPAATMFESPPTQAARTVLETPRPTSAGPTVLETPHPPPPVAAPRAAAPTPAAPPPPAPSAKTQRRGSGLWIGLGAAGCLLVLIAIVAIALASGVGSALLGRSGGVTATAPVTGQPAPHRATDPPHPTVASAPSVDPVVATKMAEESLLATKQAEDSALATKQAATAATIEGVWLGTLFETTGDKRKFEAELEIKHDPASGAVAGVIVTHLSDGSLREVHDVQGKFDGHAFFFDEKEGRHYWGNVAGDRLQGIAAWGCYECDKVWGEFNMTRQSSAPASGGATSNAVEIVEASPPVADGLKQGASVTVVVRFSLAADTGSVTVWLERFQDAACKTLGAGPDGGSTLTGLPGELVKGGNGELKLTFPATKFDSPYVGVGARLWDANLVTELAVDLRYTNCYRVNQ